MSGQAKPLVVLVDADSLLRVWMEKTLGKSFHVRTFSRTEEGIAFMSSVQSLDVLVTDLDFGSSVLGGCNIAREMRRNFPLSHIFIFSDSDRNDHRRLILDSSRVHWLSKPFGALFLASYVKQALHKKSGRIA